MDRDGETLLRAVEAALSAVPKTIRLAYEPNELLNGTWLILRSREVQNPTKLHVRSAAIDFHRMNTRYRKGQRHGDQFTGLRFLRERSSPNPEEVYMQKAGGIPEPDDRGRAAPALKSEIAEHLRDVRRSLGTDGLLIFLLSRVMELSPNAVNVVLDFDPASSLGRSITAIAAAPHEEES